MKLSIRLQNKGVRNHPRWWIVVAPNRKNIFGRFIEHVGYWYPQQGIYLKRQVILNMARIKYWISCGAVPTYRVQHFLNWFGVMPKPWFFEKTEEQLAKENDKGPEPTEKQLRKIELKRRKKERLAQGIFDMPGRHRLVGRVSKYEKGKKLERMLKNILDVSRKENEYLQEMLTGEEMKKYLRVKELSGQRVTNLTKQREELDRIRKELAYLEENSKKMHPLKQSMLIERINQLMPQISQLEEEEERRIRKMENESLQEGVLGRAALHEIMTARLDRFNTEVKRYFELLEPLTKQSYAEYLISKKGLSKNEAEARASQDFDEFEYEGRVVTRGDLEGPILNGMTPDDIPLFNEPSQDDEIYDDYKTYMNEVIKDNPKSEYIFNNQGKIRAAIQSGELILPNGNPVNPYPDYNEYIPDDYYEVPPKQALTVNAPALYPEEELERFMTKLALKKPIRGKTDLREPV